MCEREQRGVIIAATKKIRQKGKVWIVPSQAGNGVKYTVCPDQEHPHCSCPDHEATSNACKHIFAVRIVIQRELFEDGSEVETQTIEIKETRKTYSQNWPAYNRAQVNEKEIFQTLLRDVCKGLTDPPRGTGRKPIPRKDAIFAAVFKVYSTVSGRRFMTDLREAKAKGHIDHAACYNSIFHILENEDVTEVLTELVIETANPLTALESHFSCDSSGFSSARFDRWFDHKWGDIRCKRAWTKAHVMIGAQTQVITAVEIHSQMAGDSPQLIPLMESTAKRFSIQELSADLAYSTEENLTAITAIGADPLIPFKKNATSAKGGIWAKMFHYFQFNRDEFMSRYHQRSKVESAFSMIKRKFGDGLRSKTDTAMKNETLCKFICHNICCLISAMQEFGINPSFWAEKSVVGQN